MATLHRYLWQDYDNLWSVCGRYLADSGWSDTPTFYYQVVLANPLIWDWCGVVTGTRIVLPFASASS